MPEKKKKDEQPKKATTKRKKPAATKKEKTTKKRVSLRTQKTTQKALEARERAVRAYKWRIEDNKTYRQIAELNECSIGTVHTDIWMILEENSPKDKAEHYRAEQTQTLEAQNENLLKRYKICHMKEMEAIQKNQPELVSEYGRLADGHYNTYLKNLAVIARLNGVQAPVQHEITMKTVEDHQAELDQIIREQKAKLALEAQAKDVS